MSVQNSSRNSTFSTFLTPVLKLIQGSSDVATGYVYSCPVEKTAPAMEYVLCSYCSFVLFHHSQDFLRRIETLSVLTCCSWSTYQQTSSFSSYLLKILEWAQRQGNEPQLCQLSSRSLLTHLWKLWALVSLFSFGVSNPTSTRSQWFVLNVFSVKYLY